MQHISFVLAECLDHWAIGRQAAVRCFVLRAYGIVLPYSVVRGWFLE